MRIGIDVSQIVYQGSGVATYTRELVLHLLKGDNVNDYTLYAGSLRRRKELEDISKQKIWNKAKWEIHSISPRIADLLFNSANISIDNFVGPLDIFHTSDWTHPSISIPTITTVHDLVFKKFPQTLHPRIRKTQARRLKRAVKRSNHFIADSRSTKKDLSQLYAVPENKITVIYPGVSSEFKPQSLASIAKVKDIFGIEGEYVLSVAKREPRKNTHKIIEAFNKIRSNNPDLSLVLAGDQGWGDSDISQSDKIINTEFVDSSILPSLYSGASVFVYPSLYEGFGFPVLEAMASGTPVVTSNLSSLPEISGDAAVLVNPQNTDKIAKGIMEALKRRKSLSEKGIKRASLFRWSKTATETLALYKKVHKESL